MIDDVPEPLLSRVIVGGLRKAVRVLHVTDTHVCRVDEGHEHAKACRGRWEMRKGDALERRVERIFARAAEGDLDAVLLTGDIVEFPMPASLMWVRERLERCAAPVHYIAGNHDANFSDTPWNGAIRAKELPRLAPLFGPRAPALFDRFEIGGLQFLSVDDSTYQISEEQLEFVRKHLAGGMPTVLMIHIPLSTPELKVRTVAKWKAPILMGEPLEAWAVKAFMADPPVVETAAFIELLRGAKNLQAVLCGHVHFAHEERFSATALQLVGPAGFDGECRVIEFVPGK